MTISVSTSYRQLVPHGKTVLDNRIAEVAEVEPSSEHEQPELQLVSSSDGTWLDTNAIPPIENSCQQQTLSRQLGHFYRTTCSDSGF